MVVKIPAGYAHAGRWGTVESVGTRTVTVTVPQKRRIMSPRITRAAAIVLPLEVLSETQREILRKG